MATDEGQFFINTRQSCKDVLSVFQYFLATTVKAAQARLLLISNFFSVSNNNLSDQIYHCSDSPHQHLWQPYWLRTSNISCFFWLLRWRANITNITESPGIKFRSYSTCVKDVSYNHQFLQKQTTLEQLLTGITTILVFLTVLSSM